MKVKVEKQQALPTLEAFDPSKHGEGVELWEVITAPGSPKGVVAATFRKAQVTYDEAKATPWYYAVPANAGD